MIGKIRITRLLGWFSRAKNCTEARAVRPYEPPAPVVPVSAEDVIASLVGARMRPPLTIDTWPRRTMIRKSRGASFNERHSCTHPNQMLGEKGANDPTAYDRELKSRVAHEKRGASARSLFGEFVARISSRLSCAPSNASTWTVKLVSRGALLSSKCL